jgi:hypothetical protein
MLKRSLRIAAFAALLTSLSVLVLGSVACSQRLGLGLDPAVKGRDMEMNTAYFIDRGLNRKIAVQNTNGRRTPGGTLEVSAVLRNTTNESFTLEGRAFFYDLDNNVSDGPTAWKRVFLSPHTTEGFVALSTRVEDVNYYHIEFRKAR